MRSPRAPGSWAWLSVVLASACSDPAPVVPLDATVAPDDVPAVARDAAPDARDAYVPCVRPRRARDAGVGRVPAACNGAPALCDRRYDEVAYPTAHNAMSAADEGWGPPNQRHGIPRALADGVRGLMIDTHLFNGEPHLCHGLCQLGRKRLTDALCEIGLFLDEHPDEVVTLQIEDHISPAETEAAFVASGLVDDVHALPPSPPWPTLREMIAADRRLVVFAESRGGSPAWYHDLFDYSFDTPYSFRTEAEFSCRLNRGARTNPLFTVNHWVGNPLADPAGAARVNARAVLMDRVQRCRTETGRLPNFVAVDFYDAGDLFAVVRALNGL